MIGQHRIFFEHYQFFLFDSTTVPYEIDEEWSDQVIKKGYLQGSNSIHVVTIGDHNDHAVSIHMGQPAKDLPDNAIDITTNIAIDSGKLKLSSPAYGDGEEPDFEIDSGTYQIKIRVLNPGVEEPERVAEIEDFEFFKLKHLERYELYFEKSTA